MDLYTLTDTFLADKVVDEYVSAIWTERYSAAGDTKLVVPATEENLAMLTEGTFLACRGSKDVMILETQSIEKGLATIVGTDLLSFLNERMAWFANPASSEDYQRVSDLTLDTMKPGEFIAHVVDMMVLNPTAFATAWASANLDWANEIIPNLSLGPVDTSGAAKRLTATVGPLYDSIAQVAMKEGVGISIYLASADPDLGYSLEFSTYRGNDHTSSQSINPLIRLSPNFESITDLKELRSIADWKNVAYVYYKGTISKHLEDPSAPEPTGLDRRVLLTNAEGEPVGHKQTQFGRGFYYDPSYGNTIVVGPTEIAAFREQNARDALANHNYIRAMDGQTSPQNDYKYGVDYGLGDIIELEGLTGLISKARVTEYIRSDDNLGEREYPTISVV